MAVQLEKRTGRPYARRTITMATSRLRKLLQTRGRVNPLLVETAKGGVRLRVRRVAA